MGPRVAVTAALLLLAGCSRSTPPIILATTTSVGTSGLLDRVLAMYSEHPVRMLQVGSGRALAMLAENSADVIISHAPERETHMLRTHPTWFYRKILYNDFLIVGPHDDPARIGGMVDAIAAMKSLANSGQPFVSRGDESGTHERERQLWKAAGVVPSVVVAGASMAQTLRTASATKAYTLTDRGTFDALAESVELRVLVSGDPGLLNTYAVVADASKERGVQFARWLVEGDGRRVLSDVLNGGSVKGFTLWPADRNGTQPDARPFN